jgi:hypothetical protein
MAHVTAATVAHYLRTHPIRPHARPEHPEFLIRDEARAMWYVRWPNGSVRWESVVSLVARSFTPPATPLLGDVA